MTKLQEEESYEDINYRELLKLQPDNFYLHLPLQIPYTKWFYEARLWLLMYKRIFPNYFGMRHEFNPHVQWFYDWVFINHYQYDYLVKNKWKPSLMDRIRYQWLMRQGYAKEDRHYSDILARKNERKATVQERKFIKIYQKCRFWSYFDYVHDDEISLFRTGVDADEQPENINQPLFPDIAFSDPDEPILAHYRDNILCTEYMPIESPVLVKTLARTIMRIKWAVGEKVTYADMRDMFNPATIKVHDLEFIMHCFDKHGGPPEDKKEKKLYNRLYRQYSTEITYIAHTTHIPALKNRVITSRQRKPLNPLFVAYKLRWLGVNPVKEFEKVFHGVTREEYQEIVNKQYEFLDKKHKQK